MGNIGGEPVEMILPRWGRRRYRLVRTGPFACGWQVVATEHSGQPAFVTVEGRATLAVSRYRLGAAVTGMYDRLSRWQGSVSARHDMGREYLSLEAKRSHERDYFL